MKELEVYYVEIQVSRCAYEKAPVILQVRAHSEKGARERAQDVFKKHVIDSKRNRELQWDLQWDLEPGDDNSWLEINEITVLDESYEEDVLISDEGIPLPVDPRQMELPSVKRQ